MCSCATGQNEKLAHAVRMTKDVHEGWKDDLAYSSPSFKIPFTD